MITENELSAWLMLSRVSGIGSKKLLRLLTHFPNPAEVFNASVATLTAAGVSQKDATNILEARNNSESVAPDLDWQNASDKHHIITLNCPEYPARLKQISDPPALLYVHGNLNILQDPQLGIVGSRNPTQSGINNAYEFAKHLAHTGLCITSGLALGVDGKAHQGALDGNGPTIAVTATGIDRVYPARHRDLAHQIVETGAIVSEFPLGTHPDSRHFPRRNRIISGMSYGILVVEAAQKSGSLITARLAMEQNRDVFAIPGSIHNPLARGCHQLIRQGAKLVETAEDILEEMARIIDLNDHQTTQTTTQAMPTKTAEANAPPNSDLNPEQQQLLAQMGFDPITIDQLVLTSQYNAAEIAAMLLILELQNYVATSGAGTYTRLK